MVEWLAGNRLRGTSTERTAGTPAVPQGEPEVSGVGGWKELGRSTASGGETSLSVSSLSDKQYYQVITTDHGISGAPARLWRFNNDSGSNYSRRVSYDGSDGTSVSQTSHNELSINNTSQNLSIHHIANLSNKEKLQITHGVGGNSSAASVAPDRVDFVGKWANTSDAINRIDYIANSGSFSSGDELIVLGWDPADTHTTNFWEELASVTASGSSANLSSGTITAKKYLWIQAEYSKSSNGTLSTTFNNDTGSNYSFRKSTNGGADGTFTGQASIAEGYSQSQIAFLNIFIINNASNEKLVIANTVLADGTGAGTAPTRIEYVGKWANTSNQITEIDLDSSGGNFDSHSMIKVWGSD